MGEETKHHIEHTSFIRLQDMPGRTFKWQTALGTCCLTTDATFTVAYVDHLHVHGSAVDTGGEICRFTIPKGVFVDMWRIGMLEEVNINGAAV